jgi:hypothetical protein
VGAADAGPMQIQLGGRNGVRASGSCAAEHERLRFVARDWLEGNRMPETVVEEAARRDLFAGGAEKDAARGSAWRVRVGESVFMRQS